LNSGGCGEAFTRLLGAGILDDMPEIIDIPKKTKDFGVFVTKPKSKKDKGVIEVITTVGRSLDYRGCRFRFTASLSDIDQRLRSIKKEEIEQRKADEINLR
jgi:hypothetical protein